MPRGSRRSSSGIGRLLGASSVNRRGSRSALRGPVLLILGLLLALSAGVADAYLHRGIETSSSPPFVAHVAGRGLATNIDLRDFPESQIETVAATIRANGFQFVRHPFVWSEIETAEGEYDWERYDAIVRSFSDAGVEIVAVVYGTPSWARLPEHVGFNDAPPVDPLQFAEFTGILAERYRQYIRVFQVGNQPNNPGNWGGVSATGTEYLAILAPTFNSIRSENPDGRVILAELDPRGNSSAIGDDLRFLESIYRSGGSPYFDVVAAMIDGGTASPFDRRISSAIPSLSRAVLFRELLLEHGDDMKPIWFTHYGWDGLVAVSRQTQADYLVAGTERIREEWPWAGLAFQWALRPDTVDPEDAGRALLNSDGTATLAFNSVVGLVDQGIGTVAPTGFVPTDAGPVSYSGTWASQHLAGRVLQTTSQTGARLTITFEGTGIVAYLRRSPDVGMIHATVNGEPLPGWPEQDGNAQIDLRFYQAEDITVTLVTGLDNGVHEVVLELASPGNVTFGGVVVSRDPPLRWPVVLAMVSALVMTFFAVWEIMLYLSRYSKTLRTSDDQEVTPRLPSMPDWRPSLRT